MCWFGVTVLLVAEELFKRYFIYKKVGFLGFARDIIKLRLRYEQGDTTIFFVNVVLLYQLPILPSFAKVFQNWILNADL